MTYKGHIDNGAIILDEPVSLANGISVTVDVHVSTDQEPLPPRSRLEIYRNVIGSLPDKPENWAERHDDYLRERIGS